MGGAAEARVHLLVVVGLKMGGATGLLVKGAVGTEKCGMLGEEGGSGRVREEQRDRKGGNCGRTTVDEPWSRWQWLFARWYGWKWLLERSNLG